MKEYHSWNEQNKAFNLMIKKDVILVVLWFSSPYRDLLWFLLGFLQVGSRIGSLGLFEVCVNWLELSKKQFCSLGPNRCIESCHRQRVDQMHGVLEVRV